MILALYFIEEQWCGAYKLALTSIDFHVQFKNSLCCTELVWKISGVLYAFISTHWVLSCEFYKSINQSMKSISLLHQCSIHLNISIRTCVYANTYGNWMNWFFFSISTAIILAGWFLQNPRNIAFRA